MREEEQSEEEEEWPTGVGGVGGKSRLESREKGTVQQSRGRSEEREQRSSLGCEQESVPRDVSIS